jgi:IS5 family transposase
MRQIRKGKQWYFGMKVLINVNKYIGLNHTIKTTAANVHDFTFATDLMHGQQTVDSADSGFQGIEM